MACSGKTAHVVAKYRESIKAKVLAPTGLTRIHYLGAPLTEPLVGQVSGLRYPFHQRTTLYVDQRDLVFILGTDFEELE